MNSYRFVVLLAALAFLGAVRPAGCAAFDGWNYDLLGVRGFGYSGSLYGLGRIPTPPYFALHPPVYYGDRYYRSYGDSPFARHPARCASAQALPQVIVNPFVQQVVNTEQAAAHAGPSAPEMIINPFYVPDAAEPEAGEGDAAENG
jgi:hypothetical protein